MKIQNGEVQWIIGKKDATLSSNGDAMMLMQFAGEAGGVACVGEVISNYHCFTNDGLSLGWLLTDAGGNAATVGYNTIDIENAGQATFIQDKKTGKFMIFSITTGDLRILEVVCFKSFCHLFFLYFWLIYYFSGRTIWGQYYKNLPRNNVVQSPSSTHWIHCPSSSSL